MPRKAIPKALLQKLLYESSYACVVCQQRCSHVHHIDQNNSNNAESNLVVLCATHHEDAHTVRQLSQNMTPQALLHAKGQWTAQVAGRRQATATVPGQVARSGNSQLASMGIAWGYINHARMALMADPTSLPPKERGYFDYCRGRGLVDAKGVLVKPATAVVPTSYVNGSIYDWYDHSDAIRLHVLYSGLVDQVSGSARAFHLDSNNWDRTHLSELMRPGDLLFAARAFYFKQISATIDNQHRSVRASARKLAIEFFIDTRNMFGTTSMTVSFTGHSHCAALVQVKSISRHRNSLTLHCTPLALGVGFNKVWI